MPTTPHRVRGVTLVELLLVSVIVGILGTMAVSGYARYINQAKTSAAIADLKRITVRIAQFRLNNNDTLPITLAAINSDTMRDPWDHPYVFVNFSTLSGMGAGGKRKDHNLVPINSEYDLYSSGPDGESRDPLTARASRDDIIIANNGSFVGKASDY